MKSALFVWQWPEKLRRGQQVARYNVPYENGIMIKKAAFRCDLVSLRGKVCVTKSHTGGHMASTRLRQQGGAVVLTIPSDIAAKAGWTVGIELDVTAEGESVNIVPVARVPRGRRTVAQLLAGIDQQEIQGYNEEIADGLGDAPQDREVI